MIDKNVSLFSDTNISQGAVNLDLGIGIHWYGGSGSAAGAEMAITRTNWHEHPLAPAIRRSMCD